MAQPFHKQNIDHPQQAGHRKILKLFGSQSISAQKKKPGSTSEPPAAPETSKENPSDDHERSSQ